MKRLLLSALAVALLPAWVAGEVKHPYMLWTPQQARQLKQTYESQDWMAQSLNRMARNRKGETFVRLFRYQVLGDEKAGDAERKYLLSFIGAKEGNIRHAGMNLSRHYDNYLHALRYDALYHTLTDQQREKLQATFRRFIQYELDHPYQNNRLSLLPNMQLPRLYAAHLMAVALGDEELIRKLWAGPSGFKWYIGRYLSDGRFYNEEFGKMAPMIGQMLLFCRGLDGLGLSEMGYDYVAENGASMRRYIESYAWLTYPRTEIPGGMPRFERVTMGDARGGKFGVFHHANVEGYLPGETFAPNADDYFLAYNMTGRDHRGTKTGKLQTPMFFEIMAAKYPDGPFRFFLAQMRGPDQDKYIPSPFWGLDPIGPEDVTAPEAPSALWPQRGFALLRAEQSADYWTSPAPAVAFQLAKLYVHYTSDCFSLLGFHAFNRPIYLNRTISAGYNGGPWDFSVRGHAGVVVDHEQAQPIGRVPSRTDFNDLVQFTAARGKLAEGAEGYKGRGEVRSSDQPREPFTDIYSNMDLARALLLTREYLFDVYWLADEDGKARDYHWLVHAPGLLETKDGWKDSTRLQETLMNVKPIPANVQPRSRTWEHAADPADSWIQIDGEMSRTLDENPLDLTVIQRCALEDPSAAELPKAWYDREIGVRLRMLGQAGTTAYVFDTPHQYRQGTHRGPREDRPRNRPETGGISVAVARRAPETMFVALHEPVEKATSRIDSFQRIAQTDDAVAVAVKGRSVDDRLMVRLADGADKSITLAGSGESFTFTGHAFVRIQGAQVQVRGNLEAMSLKAPAGAKLIVNGRAVDAEHRDGKLTWSAK
ncbi:MAG: hypothetical protein ACLFUJ_12175 [Phycisphaerae bacterium]